MVRKPLPHGIRNKFSLSSKDCHAVKVHDVFVGTPVTEWNDLSKMVEHFLLDKTMWRRSSNEALSLLIKSLRTIHRYRVDYYALRSYCDALVEYY